MPDGKYCWECPDCGAELMSDNRPVSCDNCESRQTPVWVGRTILLRGDRLTEGSNDE